MILSFFQIHQRVIIKQKLAHHTQFGVNIRVKKLGALIIGVAKEQVKGITTNYHLIFERLKPGTGPILLIIHLFMLKPGQRLNPGPAL